MATMTEAGFFSGLTGVGGGHEPEKSDSVVVATKPTNKAECSVAEPVEPRTGGQGESGPAKHVPGTGPGKRVTSVGPHATGRGVMQLVASYPRQEPDALIGPVRICAG